MPLRFPWGRSSLAAATVGLAWLAVPTAWAQQAIINLPSADLTPKGEAFAMNESFVRPYGDGTSEWKTTNFFTYGLTDTTELAVTTFNAGLPRTDNFTVAVGFKSVIPLLQERLKERELKWTVGAMLPISMQGRGVGSYGYTHLSMRLPKVRTRVTAGVNAGTDQIFDRDVVSFIGAIEHPIGKEWNLIAEYYSGTHNFAGLVTGLIYHRHKSDTVFVLGYRIPPNPESGRHGFVFEIGQFFGPFGKERHNPDHPPRQPIATGHPKPPTVASAVPQLGKASPTVLLAQGRQALKTPPLDALPQAVKSPTRWAYRNVWVSDAAALGRQDFRLLAPWRGTRFPETLAGRTP